MLVQPLGREDPLEEGIATHSSILAWRIPLTEETGGLQSMGLQRVAGYSPWGCKESDMTEATEHVWITNFIKRMTISMKFEMLIFDSNN